MQRTGVQIPTFKKVSSYCLITTFQQNIMLNIFTVPLITEILAANMVGYLSVVQCVGRCFVKNEGPIVVYVIREYSCSF